MAKEHMGPLASAICVLWETTEKTWQRSFALSIAGSDQLAGGFEFYFDQFGRKSKLLFV